MFAINVHVHHHQDFGPVEALVQKLKKAGQDLMANLTHLRAAVSDLEAAAGNAVRQLEQAGADQQAEIDALTDRIDTVMTSLANAVPGDDQVATPAPAEPDPSV